ncbi:hypothetical protein E2R55_06150 [Vibrio vulnificus]|nr:hypothetical protein E2R55_06150 [Vibrio vulnificus]
MNVRDFTYTFTNVFGKVSRRRDIRKFGYIRVSSKVENEGRQLSGQKEKGLDERVIFTDKQSGKNFDREQFQLLKRMIRKGDVLYIHSLQEWNDITKKIQADIVVMDMPLLDTTQFKESLGTFIADLVLQILDVLKVLIELGTLRCLEANYPISV